jgi:VanZ family protein
MLSSRWWRVGFVLTLAAVMVLALLPGSGESDWFAQADKLRHAVAFITMWWIGKHTGLFSTWRLAWVLLAFGISIEVAQSFTTYREASVWDVMADAGGIVLGAGLWRLHLRLLARQTPRE